MKRGDVILCREAGSPASKARPCVIVQRSSALPAAIKMTVCPLTTRLRGVPGQRPLIVPSAANGLTYPSEVEVDWIFTYRIESFGGVIGEVDQTTLDEIDEALRRWLDL